jgi:hypothetical protein
MQSRASTPLNRKEWHRWFAWLPVCVPMFCDPGPRRWVWLETVERREVDVWMPDGSTPHWEYRIVEPLVARN